MALLWLTVVVVAGATARLLLPRCFVARSVRIQWLRNSLNLSSVDKLTLHALHEWLNCAENSTVNNFSGR